MRGGIGILPGGMWPEILLARSDDPSGVLGLLVFAAVVIIATLPRAVKENRKRVARRAWMAAAKALKFNRRECLFRRLFRLHGTVDGQTVTVRSLIPAPGQTSTEGTFYDVEFKRPLGTGLYIRARSELHPPSDFHSGDPQFDREVGVRTVDARDARDWLDADRRARIGRAMHTFPGLVIQVRGLKWERSEISTSAQELVADVRQLAALARSLLRPAPATNRETRSEPPPPPPLPARRPPPPLLLEPEAPQPGFAPAFVPVPVLEPESTPTEGRTARGVAMELFAGGLSSYEADRKFKAEIEGTPVSGTGVLVDVDAYSVDFDFGGSAGTKAVLKLEGLPEETFANREVLVLLELPEGQKPVLTPRIGESLAFAGTLHRADAFLRKLLVKSATIR